MLQIRLSAYFKEVDKRSLEKLGVDRSAQVYPMTTRLADIIKKLRQFLYWVKNNLLHKLVVSSTEIHPKHIYGHSFAYRYHYREIVHTSVHCCRQSCIAITQERNSLPEDVLAVENECIYPTFEIVVGRRMSLFCKMS